VQPVTRIATNVGEKAAKQTTAAALMAWSGWTRCSTHFGVLSFGRLGLSIVPESYATGAHQPTWNLLSCYFPTQTAQVVTQTTSNQAPKLIPVVMALAPSCF
jgi:hypothetical protein